MQGVFPWEGGPCTVYGGRSKSRVPTSSGSDDLREIFIMSSTCRHFVVRRVGWIKRKTLHPAQGFKIFGAPVRI